MKRRFLAIDRSLLSLSLESPLRGKTDLTPRQGWVSCEHGPPPALPTFDCIEHPGMAAISFFSNSDKTDLHEKQINLAHSEPNDHFLLPSAL